MLYANYGVSEEPFGEFMKEVQALSEGRHEKAKWEVRNFLNVFTKRRKFMAELEDIIGLGELVGWVRSVRKRDKLRLEIVKRSDDVAGFVVLPKRWIVERTFAWLYRCRRLSRDYEYLTSTSESMIQVATINSMLRRLAR